MGGDELTLTASEAASLLDWWLEAGVDALVAEEPRAWLKPPLAEPPAALAPPEPEAAPKPAPAIPVAAGPLPDTIDAFHAWIGGGANLPFASAGSRPALPHGPAEAALMIIADAPDSEDDSRPVGGDSFALMTRMLRAIGLGADDVYVAALSCFPLLGRRIDPASLERCRELVLHQVALVKPRRVLLFGDGAARALTGLPVAQARGKVHRVAGIHAVASFHPRWLLKRPADKARAWADLLLLMGEPT